MYSNFKMIKLISKYFSIKKFLFIFLILIVSYPVFSQSTLFTPLEIQKAYDKGTRSTDGKPGINYWQILIIKSMHNFTQQPER